MNKITKLLPQIGYKGLSQMLKEGKLTEKDYEDFLKNRHKV